MRNFIITVNGKQYDVGVEEVDASGVPAMPSAPKAVPLAAPSPAATASNVNGTKVLSPFPGLIKNVLVQSGNKIKKDQPILVLEAMKMDNDITAPCDGTVTVNVVKGANVESDAVLAVIS
ncbi:MAG: acetyl-CoA carboxylase biotin carboxyl carrier protein subunit [Clostridia bacterium]|nr:acetyl-CoA carboxylase biotin carboxyl carrier protein subunit [Clostridia bacterium]